MADLQLVVGGTAYGGWESIRVRRSLEEMAGHFELGVSELWPEQLTPREIRTGDKCAVIVEGETAITGHVDTVTAAVDAHSHGTSITGRDATADLVDCAAIHAKGEWRNARLDQIARDLAAPYGIAVKVEADIGAAFPAWAVQDGESIHECIERAARQRGVLLTSDGRGALVLGKAGKQRIATALVVGEDGNVTACSVTNDATERFQHYIVKGQRAGSDDVSGDAASAMKAGALDAGVARPRTLVIVAEDEGDVASLQRRAKWEASVRAARALTANVTIPGWAHKGGVWAPNQLVRLTAPVLRIDRDLLIRDVELVADGQGARTELTLTPAEAYDLLAMPEKKKAPRRKKAKGDGGEDFLS